MHFRNLREYHDYLIKLIASNGLHSDVHRVKYALGTRNKSSISSEPHLTFSDGATLRFIEVVELDDRSIKRLKYSYHFERNGYFFRYDKDPDRARPYCHHETHLHANQENVRFITHETSFEEVFKFIMTCFYS